MHNSFESRIEDFHFVRLMRRLINSRKPLVVKYSVVDNMADSRMTNSVEAMRNRVQDAAGSMGMNL